MTELVELYSKGIKRKLANYWAAWLPDTRFAIGDIGTLNGYLFEKVGTLNELKLKYYAETDNDLVRSTSRRSQASPFLSRLPARQIRCSRMSVPPRPG